MTLLFEQGLSKHALNNRLGQNTEIKETLNLHKQTDKEISFCSNKQGRGETTNLND
jgi:hypothetical protein